MGVDEKYMQRCLQLAAKGKGQVSPNPMVGAVVVYNNRIIGEGYHRCYGQPHAEVNAINSVKNKSLLKEATIYVSLEPCAHYGKTPPCSQLIIESKIPKVVVACRDPFPSVSGKGIDMLRTAGVKVVEGVLETEAIELNREFMKKQQTQMPYVCLKWAESSDGFIDKCRDWTKEPAAVISNDFTSIITHKRRAEIDAIMIGTNTAIKDNASLTTRLWSGENPIRIVLDRTNRISSEANIFNANSPTWVFTEAVKEELVRDSVVYIPIKFDEYLLVNILTVLSERKVNSLLVEGGAQLLQDFIDHELWDKIYREIGCINLGTGVPAPYVEAEIIDTLHWKNSICYELKRLS